MKNLNPTLKATSIKIPIETYDAIKRLSFTYYQAKPSEIIRCLLDYWVKAEVSKLEDDGKLPSVLEREFELRKFLFKGDWMPMTEWGTMMEQFKARGFN